MYTKQHYLRDVERAWQQAKPHLKKGAASPFRAAVSKKTSHQKELGYWLVMLMYIPKLLVQLIFYSIRLLLGK